MKNMHIKIKGKNSFILYSLVLCLLLFSGSGIQVIFPRASSYLLIFVTGLLLLRLLFGRLKNNIVVPICFVFFIMMSMLLNLDFPKFDSYVVVACIIISAYVVVRIFPVKDLLHIYSNIIFLSALISIIGYIIVNSENSIPFEKVYISDNQLYKYHTVYFYNWIEGLPERNCGFFWEPGIFASHLILVMQYQLFSRGKKWRYIIIETVALFTCNSTAGFFLLVIFFAEILIGCNTNNKKYRILKGIISGGVLITLFLIVINLDTIIYSFGLDKNEYIKKLLSENLTKNTRFLSIAYNIKMFLKSPLLGNGLTGSVIIDNISNLTPDTTTSFYMLNAFGLIGALFTILLIRGILKINFLSITSRILLLCTIMIIINKEPHYAMATTWGLLFGLLDAPYLKESYRRKSIITKEEMNAFKDKRKNTVFR